MTLKTLQQGAIEKGLSILGTGDVTQPEWMQHLKRNLVLKEDSLMFESVSFILTTEIEDTDSIHHLILLPDFESVEELRGSLADASSNLDHEWGGRPRVNLRGEEIAGRVRDAGGLIGPAHAFTPFRSVFREGKYDSLAECYGKESNHVHFIELGLSADTAIADCIPELRELTFITASDAHSPTPDKLGREFTGFEMESPSFSELMYAIQREKGRRPVLNVGFNPRLGKYYLSFCSSCRKTLHVTKGESPPEFDDSNIYIACNSKTEELQLLRHIHLRKVKCPADGKSLRLGVRDRAFMLGDGESVSPDHRPHYLHMPPLLELIRTSLGVKSSKAKSVMTLYRNLIQTLGTEIEVLTSSPLERIEKENTLVAQMISAYRSGTVGYVPGGGGRYGQLIAPWEKS
jgi:PHP family Zn ribbon phosphoesterase